MGLGVCLKVRGKEVFSSNITHNLGAMADACGVYYACWRPEEIGCKKAKHILPLLWTGIGLLKACPDHFKKFNSPNGWGKYEHFLPWLEEYAKACETYPNARIEVDR